MQQDEDRYEKLFWDKIFDVPSLYQLQQLETPSRDTMIIGETEGATVQSKVGRSGKEWYWGIRKRR